jgi:hypothetical protein
MDKQPWVIGMQHLLNFRRDLQRSVFLVTLSSCLSTYCCRFNELSSRLPHAYVFAVDRVE